MDELAKRFADLAEKYGPNVVDAALGAARMEAFSTLMGSLLWGFSALCIAAAGRFLWRVETSDDTYSGVPQFFACFAFTIAFFCSLVAIWAIVDPWTWTAMSHPDLYIAKRVLKL